jgi:hypothetical protein
MNESLPKTRADVARDAIDAVGLVSVAILCVTGVWIWRVRELTTRVRCHH